MNGFLGLACVCVLWLTDLAAADLQFAGTKVHFASAGEGRQLLMEKDDFIRRLSPFDRAARMKMDRTVSENEFLKFVGSSVANWTKEEMHTVQDAFDAIQPLVSDLTLSLPARIQVVKTTGAEEGNAAYTRGTAIIFPRSLLQNGPKEVRKTLCHELFHILSRADPELRERLYAIIGFKKCDEVKLPPEFDKRRITNPDAPRNDHYIRLHIDADEHLAVPILLSATEQYDVKRGGEFFAYLQFYFLILERDGDPPNLRTAVANGAPRLAAMQRVSGFMEQVGRNTEYIIHPEEILADNFALLVLQHHAVATPEIPRKMRELLFRKRPKA